MEKADNEKHLWDYRWARDVLILLVTAFIIYAAYQARAILAPVLVGMALAYVLNPVVTWAQESRKIPRVVTTGLILAVVVLVLVAMLIFVVPLLVGQSIDLVKNVPRYIEQVAAKFNVEIDWKQIVESGKQMATQQTADAGSAADSAATLSSQSKPILTAVTTLYNFVVSAAGAIVNFATYMSVATIIIAFCFFYFSWKWAAILRWFRAFIPPRHREQTLDVLSKMDKSVSAFIRGRLVQSIVMGIVLTIGWGFAGVPYWLLLGMGGGVLNLVPFAAALVWLAATGLTALNAAGDGSFTLMVLVWPTVVYLIAQMLDGWVVEPLVQGKATNLDPLTVLLAVAIGGTLAGLLGLVLAIPVAACVKILAQEIVLPQIRAYVAEQT